MRSDTVNLDDVMMLFTAGPLDFGVSNVAIAFGTTGDGRQLEGIGSHRRNEGKARARAVESLEENAAATDCIYQVESVVVGSKNLEIRLNRESESVNSLNTGYRLSSVVEVSATDGRQTVTGRGKRRLSLPLVGSDMNRSCLRKAVVSASEELS